MRVMEYFDTRTHEVMPTDVWDEGTSTVRASTATGHAHGCVG